jgi:hypothetical protein
MPATLNQYFPKTSKSLSSQVVLVVSGLTQAVAKNAYISACTLVKHEQNNIEKTQAANITNALIYSGILGCVGN